MWRPQVWVGEIERERKQEGLAVVSADKNHNNFLGNRETQRFQGADQW